MRRVASLMACVSLLVPSAGCTLLLPYGELATETGDAACHDRFDNDGDGMLDCDDPDCGECVGRPVIACPAGWASYTPDGASVASDDCSFPEQTWLAGCATEAPADAMVIYADDDALGVVLANADETDPSGPPTEVWLAPGTHVESADLTEVTGHVVIHGLCDRDGVPPVLTAGTNGGPLRTDSGGRLALEIDHVELRLAPAGPVWTGSLTLDHVRVAATTGAPGGMHFAERSGLVTRESVLDLPIVFDGDARLTATDTRFVSIAGRVETTLTRVEVDGSLTLEGPGSLGASALFVHCGAIALTDGAGAEIHGSVLDVGAGPTAAIRSSGAVAFRSTVTLEDVVTRTLEVCPSQTSAASGFTRTDLEMTRVLLADDTALLLEDGSVGQLLDVEIEASGRGTGALVGAEIHASRVRVTGASLAAIRVEPTAANASARFERLYVDGIGAGNDDPCSVSSAAGLLAGAPATSGTEVVGIADVSVEASRFTNVEGCAIFADEGATVAVATTEIGSSTFGLCAPGRMDSAAIGAGLAFADATTPITTESALCAGVACGTASSCQAVRVSGVDALDLLLMIDDSNSMTEEQASLAQEVPRLVEVLTTGDLDADGTQDFAPVRSLHVGVVDSDMGLGNTAGIPTCDPGFGDDGIMQIRSRTASAPCLADYSARYSATPNVFSFAVGGPISSTDFATDVSCIAQVGTAGCGFEFELEAPLKAISLAPRPDGTSPVSWTRAGYRPPTFWGGTYGHGNDPETNGAFLRADSTLAIVTINDEDDCSTPNFALFSRDNPAYGGVDLNLRCFMFESDLYPISRYAEGFLGLRRDPSLLVYASITGIPPALSGMDPDTILADPAMINQVDPSSSSRLLPACSTPGRGVAYPARRMTELAGALRAAGAATTVQSICANDFSTQIDAVLRLVADTTSGGCLPHALTAHADGTVDCELYALLSLDGEPTRCAELSTPQTRVGAEASTGREICRVAQLDETSVGTGVGWIYDDGSIGAASTLPTGCEQHVAVFGLDLPVGAELRLSCR